MHILDILTLFTILLDFDHQVGLNNIKETDFVNVTIQSLMRVTPLRNFFLIPENYQHCKSPLVQRYGELTRKIWHARNFKGQVWSFDYFSEVMVFWCLSFVSSFYLLICSLGIFQVSPHEFLQAVMKASKKRFRIGQQSDPLEFMAWLLNTLHANLRTSKKNNSIIYECFQVLFTFPMLFSSFQVCLILFISVVLA